MLKTLADTNDANLILIAQLQQREAGILADLERANNENKIHRDSNASVNTNASIRAEVPTGTKDAVSDGV